MSSATSGRILKSLMREAHKAFSETPLESKRKMDPSGISPIVHQEAVFLPMSLRAHPLDGQPPSTVHQLVRAFLAQKAPELAGGRQGSCCEHITKHAAGDSIYGARHELPARSRLSPPQARLG